ncbi:thioredoxin domain-containing protein [Candidatus Parcubacteria bacterium]|nr:thioredoxin domain-containing protein [Candidatus Parcubacteria bacterium]
MNKNNSLAFALTILISGIVIGGGIFISRTNLLANLFEKEEFVEIKDDKIQPITAEDHIIGNPDADVIIIEYSDFECPYCQEFHTTMRRIIDDYGQTGSVAWIYRQAPLEEIHSNARRIALVSECVSEIGGNNMFWNFTNQIFDNAPESISESNTNIILENLGLDTEEINSCTEEPETIKKIEDDLKDIEYIKSIDREFGTPYNIVITKTGIQENLSGALPYSLLSDFIQQNSLEF